MIPHLIEFTLVWAILLLSYQWWFAHRTTHQWNRYLLWSSLINALTIPLLPKWSGPMSVSGWSIILPAVTINDGSIGMAEVNIATSLLSWGLLIKFTVLVGFVISLFRIAMSFVHISRLKRKSHFRTEGQYQWWEFNSKELGPFSFLNSIFIPDPDQYSDHQLRQILEHETAHIRLKHGWDNMILAILFGFLWWNPLMYWFRRQLNLLHEFQADACVVDRYELKEYGHLLLQKFRVGPSENLQHAFFAHPIKNRIIMMKKSKKIKDSKWLYMAIIPVLAAVFLLHSCTEDEKVVIEESSKKTVTNNGDDDKSYNIERIDTIITFDPKTKKEEIKVMKSNETVYKVVENMPRFPGCEEDGLEGQELKDCATKNLLTFVYENVKYPKEAKENDKEGVAVVQFIVNKSGFVSDVSTIRDPGFGMGDEAKRCVREMINQDIRWNPGVQSGKKVNVKFVLPVKFKLQ